MPEERFTVEKAKEASEALSELFEGLPKTRQPSFIGHLNDISLFLEAAQREAAKK